MDINQIYMDLIEKINSNNVFKNEPMKKHTSFRIGGPADILVIPDSIDEIVYALKYCRERNIDYFVMGNGSNLLVRDKGIRGVVIKIAENFSDVKINGTKVRAQAGILLSRLSKLIINEGLEGFEFASGIPGTIGGAVTMNAGAYGGEIKDVIVGCSVIDKNGEIIYLNREDLNLGYRTSIIQDKKYVVLEVDMEFKKGDYDKIKSIVDDFTKRRTTKQPLHLPSAGSTFKRPKGYYAGKLIQDSGLKGVRVGDAQVSDLHSGFIVNLGNATAEDVLNLIKLVQKVVRDNFGVNLETEVKIIGEE
ncbi:UDP-N-acetylmuramate dehydrogenase [Caminicella sporogenes DSM 14501]|uniref:UDP-N-acetylenolpyruvoylglucosamine reductase n=1 Tax=Caminicella sporogenes DSM 14501 TaxID=1121266 RepID=A0A1M6RIT0_9FIRM|nr:UDP-N-acetylmuramate dehydrogenase [Caminicella sporogenes]RKD25252.1 UDP-N-acetylenolpyruvoylglucosamine reductase [Caminicella sporogenes]SHK32411.1 UDP-N-acetylmuramate dehydrogenase [Caminicella sporogenes DSM 14501]